MTVRELIDALLTLPQDHMVVVDGYEGGFDDPIVRVGKCTPGPSGEKSDWWEGRHGYPSDGLFGHDDTDTPCVIVGR